MENKYYSDTTMYVCDGCGDVFAFPEHAEEHSKGCIRNPETFHGSTTDKNTKILIKAPTEKDNEYKDYQLIKWLGNKNALVVETEEGYRELSEEEILEENKEGYEPIEFGTTLNTTRSEAWEKQISLLYKGIEEQRKIGESIKEFWKDIKEEVEEMEDSGVNGQDLSDELKKKYNIKS